MAEFRAIALFRHGIERADVDNRQTVDQNIGNPMHPMDWKQIIADLSAVGLTQEQIATQCGVVQATVSDLSRGITTSPSFDFGSRLLKLHHEKTSLEKRAAA